MGPTIFLAFYDEPELVGEFLDFLTDHYIGFLTSWFAEHPPAPLNAHWGFMMRGNVMLRDDSLVNLSPETYEHFVRKREARCLDVLGGGGIHFCGRGTHVVESLCRISGLSVMHMSQPELNEMEVVLEAAADSGVTLIGLCRDALAGTPTATARERPPVHVV